MKLYEYEGKEIARRYGVDVPRGLLASSVEEVAEAYRRLGSQVVVLKAQVLVGGRGLAGGVKKAGSLEEAVAKAGELFSTSIRGERVGKLLVEEAVCISRELYVSLTVDRASRRLVYLVSGMGGVEIEELARRHPDKVLRIPVDPFNGFSSYMARQALGFLGLPWDKLGVLENVMRAMYRIMVDYDAELVEFNPLAYTCSGGLTALDAKVIVDDNSLYRHPDLQPLYGRDASSYERLAKQLEFNYVELDGDIGVISNGAGLTMATMDAILHYGGRPANFLDIGGGATRERVREAAKIVLTHPRVKAVLVNIFGGITRCDEVAAGVVEALKEAGVAKPVVVRMLGTNEEEGRRILREHGINAYTEMDEAVLKVVQLAREVG
ncbi:ADP-forming succinate--CoA ligase subunit beta [Desulfurococcus mucosus]|uniref:Succinate--CoA ligase [ADP-forming] subunit beta n=1 Tax=Desulfurococcus mucosus (strain ATCC 35584 / DSM 2162 / JCM 9187 / O7/1) TaxID=765177 RepID=E8RA31_DESM0|nr:ADP-forming succinate--CoA ligase subunit beta [Desulfurococcus mucosus]ADV65357.1 succinyl-CoA synthetase (ADP-forming) beta subunit [Desulfurococcus mucosus DSM 2162]